MSLEIKSDFAYTFFILFREAYRNDGARSHSSHSRSPQRASLTRDAYRSYDGHSQNIGMPKTDGWDVDRHGADIRSGRKFEFPAYPQTLEELEMEFKREAMEFGRIRDKEEDEENYKHRETIRELRETYMKKLAILRGMQAKQWEEFLQLDMQRQQRAHQHMSASSYNNYNHPNYPDFGHSSGNPHYGGTDLPADSRSRYSYAADSKYSRPPDGYGEFAHDSRPRHEDFGKTYNRF